MLVWVFIGLWVVLFSFMAFYSKKKRTMQVLYENIAGYSSSARRLESMDRIFSTYNPIWKA